MANTGLARQNASPFGIFQRLADQMDRMFEDFGVAGRDMWWPAVEVLQRNNELVVRADLPGLKKDDVKVDVTDNAITISGERRSEGEHEENGVYRSERQYGSFTRTIALPEGAITDQAKATFTNGVLEVTVPAPPEQVRRGRRIEIGEGATAKK